MKILQVNKFYFPKAGTERYVFELTKLLENKGHEVIPFAMKDKRNLKNYFNKYFVSNVDLSKPKIRPSGFKNISRIIYSQEAKKKIEKLVKKTKPDIAHVHNIYHQISPSILSVFKKYNIPVVQTLHDFKLICPNYKLFSKGTVCERCKKHKYYNAISQKCSKNSILSGCVLALEMYIHKMLKIYEKNVDIFICPSQFVKNKMIEWGIDNKKLIVIPHFVSLSKFEPNYENQGYVLYFGRLVEEKGVDILIKAMKELPRLKLKIVGKGPEKKTLESRILNLGLKNIEFLGYKAGNGLRDLVRNSMFVVCSSISYETFGLVVTEANALGKPVIASNAGALPELIEDRKTGLLFSPGSTEELAKNIKYLIARPDEIREMGKLARRKVEKEFNSELHYQKLIEVYKCLAYYPGLTEMSRYANLISSL